jgi:nitrous oxidase accessory protein NosD
MLVGIVAMASPVLGSVRHVHCDVPGQTITKALKTAQPGDTIRVRGTCAETVTITTDRVTLDGGGKAILQGPDRPGDVSQGLLNIVGVQGVEIRGLTVQTVLRTVSTGGKARLLRSTTSASSIVSMTVSKLPKPRRYAFWAPVR